MTHPLWHLSPLSLLLFCAACQDPSPKPVPRAEPTPQPSVQNADPTPTLNADDPESCRPCHGTIVEEWTQSMHSMAHHDKDPIYGAMRALRMKKQGKELASKCASCHNPRAPQDLQSPAALAGVSCATCHNINGVQKGKHGAAALAWNTNGTMRGSKTLPPGASPVHGTGPALPALADGQTLCLACHGQTQTPSGAAACTTGPEYNAAQTKETCVSCHMAQAPGPGGAVHKATSHASHAFAGPHRAWLQNDPSILQAAVDLKATADPSTSQLTVTLTNLSAHGFPTGFPGRMAIVVIEFTDQAGASIWKNIRTNPMTDDPQAVLNKVYVDKDNNPVPAAFAARLARDNRLKPTEARTITAAIPPKAVKAHVRLVYRLLPPKLATKLNLTDRPEATPKTIASTTLDLPPAVK